MAMATEFSLSLSPLSFFFLYAHSALPFFPHAFSLLLHSRERNLCCLFFFLELIGAIFSLQLFLGGELSAIQTVRYTPLLFRPSSDSSFSNALSLSLSLSLSRCASVSVFFLNYKKIVFSSALACLCFSAIHQDEFLLCLFFKRKIKMFVFSSVLACLFFGCNS